MSQFTVGVAEGVHALDYNQRGWYGEGYAVVDGCEPTDAAADLTVDIGAGTVYHGGVETDVPAQSVTVTAGQADPRKDTVWLDANGDAYVTTGTPAGALPRGAARADTYQPAPPMPGETPAVVLAVVWVPAGAGDIGAADIQDRRADSTGRFYDVTVDRLNVTPLAQGTVTLTGGDDPAADVTVTGVTTDETRKFEVIHAPDESPGWAADYAYNLDMSRVYDAANGEVNADLVATWDVDPGAGNDLELAYQLAPRY